MAWRVAGSILHLFEQVNEMAPDRDHASDGTIGDAAHATRDSDHNPHVMDGAMGVVTAGDFDHDPANGADMHEISESIRLSRDPRVKYVIFDARMFSSYPTSSTPAWTWRPYSGVNLHTIHMHLSVQPTKALYDSTKEWDIDSKEDEMKKEDWERLEKMVTKIVDNAIHDLAVGPEQKAYDKKKINIKAALKK